TRRPQGQGHRDRWLPRVEAPSDRYRQRRRREIPRSKAATWETSARTQNTPATVYGSFEADLSRRRIAAIAGVVKGQRLTAGRRLWNRRNYGELVCCLGERQVARNGRRTETPSRVRMLA